MDEPWYSVSKFAAPKNAKTAQNAGALFTISFSNTPPPGVISTVDEQQENFRTRKNY